MQVQDIKNILILGSGVMGSQIGYYMALRGLSVKIYDISKESLENAQSQINKWADYFVEKQYINQTYAEGTLQRISFISNKNEAAKDADLISESIPEDPELKGKVFGEFNELCPEHTIFTTNSSSIVPSEFADKTGRPEKLVAMHFYQYVWESNVVDIMGHENTSPEIVETVTAFAKHINQIPVVMKKEFRFYVYNYILRASNRAALDIVTSGAATPEDVDRSVMGVMKIGRGPFGTIDLIGLDTFHNMSAFWAEKLDDPELRRNADYLKTYVEQGKLGVKSGEGFYTYPNPEFEDPDFIKP